VAADGSALELHASTEALALSSAMTFLEGRFGALSEYSHGCEDFGSPPEAGVPLVIDGTETDAPGSPSSDLPPR
jgi:hypothetical protein